MIAVSNKKLCWNCEGEVHEQATRCAYCGAELSAAADSGQQQQPAPPYDLPKQQEEHAQIPTPPYTTARSSAESNAEVTDVEWEDALDDAHDQDDDEGAKKGSVIPLLALSLGSICFVFSMTLLLFSENGALTLQWNAASWPLYLFLSIPSLFIGWRKLRALS